MQEVAAPLNTPRHGSDHLLFRGRLYRAKFRADMIKLQKDVLDDAIYVSRIGESTKRYKTVFNVSMVVSKWSRDLSVEPDLVGLLQNWVNFQGFTNDFNVTMLNDLIHLDLPSYWGSLFMFCRGANGVADKWKFMFFFSVLALNKSLDPRIIQTLMAFAILPHFKTVVPPTALIYQHYKVDQIPR